MIESTPRWYVVHVYSGSEKRVAEDIREQIEKKNMQEKILDVLVPIEEIIEVRKGEKHKSERSFFPGYVLVKMNMSDEAWHMIRNTGKVTGFLGGRGKPSPISETEVSRIMNQVHEHHVKPKHTVRFEVGEQVRVSDGPFASFNGIVEDIDEEKERLKVSVSIFGRPTPVDLDYAQVEKV